MYRQYLLNEEVRANTKCASPHCNRRLCKDATKTLEFCCRICQKKTYGIDMGQAHGPACCKTEKPAWDAERARVTSRRDWQRQGDAVPRRSPEELWTPKAWGRKDTAQTRQAMQELRAAVKEWVRNPHGAVADDSPLADVLHLCPAARGRLETDVHLGLLMHQLRLQKRGTPSPSHGSWSPASPESPPTVTPPPPPVPPPPATAAPAPPPPPGAPPPPPGPPPPPPGPPPPDLPTSTPPMGGAAAAPPIPTSWQQPQEGQPRRARKGNKMRATQGEDSS
mmetsp:Transcript_57474/g.136687  ORF Transcript_57474/g.136687 Transcript_57474/m.136687 type:complete len:279 (+) Transcript_57474:64-900(+)